MVNSKIIDHFRKEHRVIFTQIGGNSYDAMVMPDIDDKRTFRNNFGVTEKEELLLCRDTSFFNSRDQGCVITDWGVRAIPDNDNPEEKLEFAWEDVDHVTFKDDVLFFWGDSSENEENWVSIHIDLITKGTMPGSGRGPYLARKFSEFASMVEPQEHPVDVMVKKMYKMDSNSEAIAAGESLLGQYPDVDYILLYHIGLIAGWDKDWQKARKYLEKFLDSGQGNEYMTTWANSMLSTATLGLQELMSDRSIMHYSFATAKCDASIETDAGVSVAKNAYDDLMNEYMIFFGQEFENHDVSERKFIYACDNILELSTIDQTQFFPVPLETLLKQESVKFPIGHPVANELYVVHPYNPNMYLVYQDSQIEILEDKLREYCEIMQGLGATEISVHLESGDEQSNFNTENQKLSGEAQIFYGNVKGAASFKNSVQAKASRNHNFNRRQTFRPTGKIAVPESAVWLQFEPNWQRTINQRLAGTLINHHESISSRSSSMTSGQSLTKLKAELQSLFVDCNLKWTDNEEYTYSSESTLSVSIDVTFSELEEQGKVIGLTASEQEYLMEYEECMNNGQISTSERRLLSRLGTRLGITEARMAEIEKSYAPVKLSPEEQEYLDEYKSCIADDGEITYSSRRLLTKLALSLGLSEEQIKSIESKK